MRTADTALSIIRERGKQGLPLERVMSLLYNRDLYLQAYARLYPNTGAMTQGSTSETVDRMSLTKIDRLIAALRDRTFRWTPVRRMLLPKPHGKMRPLGIPTWSDKMLQEVLRSILEAYYEPHFSDQSHGFRPHHGCHTALKDVQIVGTGTKWFIEGDIATYFDTIDHNILLSILAENIQDHRFLQVIGALLAAGYMEQWTYHRTYSGTPQGGVLSPLLANIYLDRLDQWVTQTLIPAYTRGERRRNNRAYYQLTEQMRKLRKGGHKERARTLYKQCKLLPSRDPYDPAYRRLWYVRYADDFLLGCIGPHEEAQQIKHQLKDWLTTQLKLTLSEEKTLITHATSGAARFLGYEISANYTEERRSVMGKIHLRIPETVKATAIARYTRNGKPIHRAELLENSDFDIVVQYQAAYRGLVQYYQPASNIGALSYLHWIM